MWNAYFLACVLAIAEKIECGTEFTKFWDIAFILTVLAPNQDTGDLFDRDYTWAGFIRRSLELCETNHYVVICDISEFYPSIGHHRLEYALQHIDQESDRPSRIIDFLSNFTSTRSVRIAILSARQRGFYRSWY